MDGWRRLDKRNKRVVAAAASIVVLLGSVALGRCVYTSLRRTAPPHPTTPRAFPRLAGETVGPRGAVGQLPPSAVPGWPEVFTSSHGTFDSLRDAVNAVGTGRRFRVMASMAFTATLAPHAGDQIWCDDGVTITRSGSIYSAIATRAPDVSIVNCRFTGFDYSGTYRDQTIAFTGPAGDSEVAYCDISKTHIAVSGGGKNQRGAWIHNNDFHDLGYAGVDGGLIVGFQTIGLRIEDNEFVDYAGDVKIVGATQMVIAHNWMYGGQRTGMWLDYDYGQNTIEWNFIEKSGWSAPLGALVVEAIGWSDDQHSVAPSSFLTAVRYNVITNNFASGIYVSDSRWTNVYGNVLAGNARSGGAEISLNYDYDPSGMRTPAFERNAFRDNAVSLHESRDTAVKLRVAGVPDASDYYTNGRGNDFDLNRYYLAGAASPFDWNGHKSFAQWQAIPQDPHGSVSRTPIPP